MRTCGSHESYLQLRSARELSVRRARIDDAISDSSSMGFSEKGFILSARLEKKFLQFDPNC